jgi:hypothetical protein
MRQFTVSAAAAIVLAATFASAPVKADFNYGPIKKGNLCWTGAYSFQRDGFGAWTACPQPASTPAARPVRRTRHH